MFDWFKRRFGNHRERWLLARRDACWDDAIAALRHTQRRADARSARRTSSSGGASAAGFLADLERVKKHSI